MAMRFEHALHLNPILIEPTNERENIMGTEPYEPIHVALVLKLFMMPAWDRTDFLNQCHAETLARMLAVLYSTVYIHDDLLSSDFDEQIFDRANQVMDMLISKLSTADEPF